MTRCSMLGIWLTLFLAGMFPATRTQAAPLENPGEPTASESGLSGSASTVGAAQLSGETVAPARGMEAGSIWEGGIGSHLRRGTRQAGFGVGGGLGIQTLGSRLKHDLVLGKVHYGRTLGPNWAWVAEAFGGAQVSPEDEWLAGGTFLIRYHFFTESRWVPYANVGAGLTYTTIGRPDLGSHFEFNLQGGLGIQYFYRTDRAFTLEGRWLHLSNAGLESPNRGTNTIVLFAGVSWFF